MKIEVNYNPVVVTGGSGEKKFLVIKIKSNQSGKHQCNSYCQTRCYIQTAPEKLQILTKVPHEVIYKRDTVKLFLMVTVTDVGLKFSARILISET